MREKVAELAHGALRPKRNDLIAALERVVGSTERLLLAIHLRNLKFLTQEIDRVSAEIEEQLPASQDVLERPRHDSWRRAASRAGHAG